MFQQVIEELLRTTHAETVKLSPAKKILTAEQFTSFGFVCIEIK